MAAGAVPTLAGLRYSVTQIYMARTGLDDAGVDFQHASRTDPGVSQNFCAPGSLVVLM